MADLIRLDFRGRLVRMVGTAEAPEWVAKDVCEVLGLTTHNAAQGVPDDEKGHCTVVTPGGPQEMATVREAGLYRLVLRSRKPDAQVFQTWIVGEVIPSLRQHGCYPPPEQLAPAGLVLEQELARTTKLVGDLAQCVGGFRYELESTKAQVWDHEQRLAAVETAQIVKREPMPAETFRIHKRFLRSEQAYDGRCPCCGRVEILDRHGTFTGHKEHATGTGDWTVEQTWLTCKDCNLGVLKRKRVGAPWKAFELYQERLRIFRDSQPRQLELRIA